ncbi:Acyl-CoA reductase [Cryptosporangium aurantiacum]|uniref:Acyl-CoA reductase n=2 Tax=Cryptosporangium aurantiacum TaxID=134849 RepID=A0A1M7R3R7_9ACTN|nr:Acyl-CoA reductase [Cryptosporangium aurantiacum]
MVWTGQFDKLFLGGEWVAPNGDDRIDVRFPGTEEVFATVPSATRGDVDRAVAAARAAFDTGPWPKLSVGERLGVLHRFRELYTAHLDTMAELITEEMGCPSRTARAVQAQAPQLLLEGYLEVAESYPFRDLRVASTGTALVTREPVGVVAAIVPWNVPQSVIMQKLAPSLITGCTVVLKPAPETPLDSYLLAELLQQAGVPDGVVNVVPADREVSEYLVAHRGVDKVSFTGSTAAGRRIAAVCGGDLRRVTLELGGKSAAVFLDDADLDTAVESLRLLSFRNSGQVCSLKTRLVVSRRREPELLERLAALVESMPVGDPHDPETQIGPMVNARQRDIVNNYIAVGQQQGARAVVGGGTADFDRGYFVQPTVFTDVRPEHRIAQEEIFGPVLAVLRYDTEDEAIAIANDSPYGLSGAVFTTDLEHGLAVAGRIRTGTVELNGSPIGTHAPVGGFKSSGIGREQGYEGFDSYTETRSIGLPPTFADTTLETR